MKPMQIDQKFNPEMLVLAREARALNQTQLATLAGITQGQISKIENGQREPLPELVATLLASSSTARACSSEMK